MAGSADFKTVIQQSDAFDKRLQAVIIATYDIQYGFEDGLNHAITQAGDALANVRFMEEKALITNFFEQINLDTGMIVFGVNDTMKALEMSAIDKILLYDEIDITRYEVKNPNDGKVLTWYLTEKQAEDPKYFKDAATGVDLETVSQEPLGDWLLVNYQHFGAKIELISDKTQEGFQFVKGFGGIGAILRWDIGNDDAVDYGSDDEIVAY